MLSKSNILSIIVINNLLTIMFGNSYKEITGVWIGSESLSSQSSNYENKDIELRISHGGDRDGFLIYESSSSLIYNQELSWAFHYLQFNQKENALIFVIDLFFLSSKYEKKFTATDSKIIVNVSKKGI